MTTPPTARPFTVDVPDDVLDDLRVRLTRTRLPDPADGVTWEDGVDGRVLADLVEAWAARDWRARERELNALDRVAVDVAAGTVQAIHLTGPDAAPALLCLHGWPDSSIRYARAAPLLRERFHVVAPDLPGFGFTTVPAGAADDAADALAETMTALGHDRFAVAGGDVGATVASALARRHPERVRSLHLTEVDYPTGQEDPASMTEAEQQFAGFIQGWWFAEGGYSMVQASKPAAVGIGLDDSPAGLLAWVLSFLNTGADAHDVAGACGGQDALLDMVTLTWVTQSATSAARTYRLDAAAAWTQPGPPARVEVPTALTIYARDAPFPREWAERSHAVARFRAVDVGGHLAAMEVPEIYAADVIDAYDELDG